MSQFKNSFETYQELKVGSKAYRYASLKAFEAKGVGHPSKLPYSHKVLLENLLRNEDGVAVTQDDIKALANWDPKAAPSTEIQFKPARILLQDFTGVPAVADLAAMRSAVKKLGGDPNRINPLQPADLVIDHSVQVDHFGNAEAFEKNVAIEYKRNKERYEFLRWGQNAFKNFRVVPPGTGIVHQVNVEYLAQVAFAGDREDGAWIYPDTLVGTDSHTTMINGLGVLGWGVGGIEAEAAMLGQPISMLIPHVIGFRLKGKLTEGTTATDLVLTVVEILRKKGVVGKFVEFFGSGLLNLTLADRATIANMAPEYGATCGIFPVDEKTLDYLKLTGRPDDVVARVEAYFKEQGMWFDPSAPEPNYTDVVELDISTVEPCLAGPTRPQDRIELSKLSQSFKDTIPELLHQPNVDLEKSIDVTDKETAETYPLKQGAVVIAAITSCTNTSNPAVLLAAGLLAKKAREKGLKTKPWVKTSLAPGSKVVTDYLVKSGLMEDLNAQRFNLVGYGCTTCIGNSGPLPEHISEAVVKHKLGVASVLSGNRNFEGRVNPHTRANYLASPPLVVAYALAGNVQINLKKDPIGQDEKGSDVFLKDIWPTNEEVSALEQKFVTATSFKKEYEVVFEGDELWQGVKFPSGDLYKWEDSSTYIKEPPFFEGMSKDPDAVTDIENAHVLALLKDSVTTDHISPAGAIQQESPAGKYLLENKVDGKDFNSFGSRRGNHEVMIRGTFGNIRLKNQLAPGTEGGFTKKLPGDEVTSIYEASMDYQAAKTPLVIFAGKEYGTGSSRDWAAKGTLLLGVKAVVAQSFERIHRSNLIGMGVLPLQFADGEGWESLGLTGKEKISIQGLAAAGCGSELTVTATDEGGKTKKFTIKTRIDTPNELEYYRHGGILRYVLRQIIAS